MSSGITALPTCWVLPPNSKANGTYVSAAGEHHTQPAGVIGEDAVQGPTRFVAAIIEIGGAISDRTGSGG